MRSRVERRWPDESAKQLETIIEQRQSANRLV
jgi:hypothetical protein